MPRRLPSLDAIVASVLRHPRRQVGAAVRRHHAELEVRGRRAFTASRGRLGEDSAATMAGGFDGAAIYGPALASPPPSSAQASGRRAAMATANAPRSSFLCARRLAERERRWMPLRPPEH